MTASLLTQLVSVFFWVLQKGFMGGGSYYQALCSPPKKQFSLR